MKKIFFATLLLLVCIVAIVLVGCDNIMPTQPVTQSNQAGVQARINIGDNPASTMWDSILTNRLVRVSSVMSTGNIVRREWKIYRWRTGLLVDTDTSTILQRTYTGQDTLIFKLKVFGSVSSDTNSVVKNVRILNHFGGPIINDIYLLSFVPSGTNRGTYYHVLPYGRISLTPPWSAPRITGSHIGFNTYESLTDSLPGVGYIWPYEATSYDTVQFNYLVNNSQYTNVWSNATGSFFKTPGTANTYTVRYINGYIYPSGGGPPSIRPGNVGDTVARFGATPTSLIIYPYHGWINSPVGQTWNEINVYSFARHNHSNWQNTNYGIIDVPLSEIQNYANQVGFSFGGSSGVANMSASQQYDPQTGRIWFQYLGPNRPLNVGEEFQLKFRDGTIITVTVQAA